MTNITFFLIFIPILATVLLLVNFILAPHIPDKNKDAQFECGFSSFTQMSRLPFSISFFVYALLFLLFDLEILLVYPYVVSAYNNSIYGLVVMLVFFILLTIGFVFELGKKALQIDSRQTDVYSYNKITFKVYLIFCNLPNTFTCIYAKYPNITNLLLFFTFYISIQLFNCVDLYCDSSPESVSSFKDKNIVIQDNPSNFNENDNNNNGNHNESSNVDIKGKGKAIYQESDPINSNSHDDTNIDIKGKGKATYQESDPGNTVHNTDNTKDTSERPFTMDKSLKDFWENTYDDDDRRRHYTVLDRLGITAEEWENDFFDRVGTIEVIKRDMDILRAQEEEDKAIASKILESLEEEDKAISKQIAESLEEKDKPTSEQTADSLEGSEEGKKRKLEESLQADEDMARKLQKSLYEVDPSSEAGPSSRPGPSSEAGPSSRSGPNNEVSSYNKAGSSESVDSDSESNYSIISSMRGDETPNTYQKKLEVLQVEFNLDKKK